MLHFVVPAGIDDAERPSGGNVYDRRICAELRARGRWVVEHRVAGADAVPDALAGLPDGERVLVDGLVASEALVPLARRLRLAVLLHMLVGDERERAVLSAAAAVITTSRWGRAQVLARYGLPAERVLVAPPGTDPAPHATGTASGDALLCVAAVAPHKGHDVLVDALASLGARPWRCVCVGSLHRDPGFVARLRDHVAAAGLADRISFAGALRGAALSKAYASADVLVHPSRGEMYGMVVAEALARGLPVIASDVGGVREALGEAGVLVPPGDPPALAAAIGDWLARADHRTALRAAAGARRAALPTWRAAAACVADVLDSIGG